MRWQETSDIPVNVLLRQAALLILDGDGLGLAGALVGGGNPHDTVGVNLEGDLNLRNTAWSRGDTGELELAKKVVVLGERTFTFEDLDEDRGLVVSGGGENLALLGGDDSITGNELGEDTTSGFDTKCQGANVDEDNIRTSGTGENTTLDGSTVGDGLVRVDTLGGLLASKELLEELLDLGNTSGTTN